MPAAAVLGVVIVAILVVVYMNNQPPLGKDAKAVAAKDKDKPKEDDTAKKAPETPPALRTQKLSDQIGDVAVSVTGADVGTPNWLASPPAKDARAGI